MSRNGVDHAERFRELAAAVAAVTWLEPTLDVEVTYSDLMEGRLRDPVYRGLV